MSKQSASAVNFNAAAVYRSGTPPPPYASSSTGANTGAPSASPSTKVNTKESAAEFIARMGLFDGQGKNPDILSIIIVANLIAADPETNKLTLSITEIATVRLKSNSFIAQFKAALKKQDPGRSGEWDKLDSDFIQMLLQYIVLQQDTAGNTYKEWIPICRIVRPVYRVCGRNPRYVYTIGDSQAIINGVELEGLRKETIETGFKGYADFMAVWVQFFGSEKQRIREANREQKRAVAQRADDTIDGIEKWGKEMERKREEEWRMLDEQRNL